MADTGIFADGAKLPNLFTSHMSKVAARLEAT